ncbi:MAG: hypothetical protein M1819_000674 [Sarea resinae]|nr:MAG: hypothetical protein M1819_000674 [Sarea resinae]
MASPPPSSSSPPAATNTTSDAARPANPHPFPTRNPMPLSAAQEAQVHELYHSRVRAKCGEEIKAFAACALNRTISATWACRPQRLAMNKCIVVHATPAERDQAREDWFAQRGERARQREEKEKKRVEQEKFHREWWNLPSAEEEAEIKRKWEEERRRKEAERKEKGWGAYLLGK